LTLPRGGFYCGSSSGVFPHYHTLSKLLFPLSTATRPPSFSFPDPFVLFTFLFLRYGTWVVSLFPFHNTIRWGETYLLSFFFSKEFPKPIDGHPSFKGSIPLSPPSTFPLEREMMNPPPISSLKIQYPWFARQEPTDC